ncbi:MAG: universal stress protein [Saprospiraceae bacterium]|nr:universal stress protein [Saprospiraceae bacterium]
MLMIEVALYGKRSSRYEYLKYILQQRSQEAHLDLSIKEINEVDDFIKENVHSIPAIRFSNNLLLECGQDEDISDFTDEVLKNLLIVNQNRSKIIVPVDFSEGSDNAIAYASRLAQKCGCQLLLTHIYHPTPVQVNGQVWVNPEGEKPFVDQLEQLTDRVKSNYTEIQVEQQFIYGFPVDELVKLSRQEDAKFIVMGTTGASDSIKRLFGSISQEVSQKAFCPVFAIPSDTDFSFKRLLYATDDPTLDVNAIKFLQGLFEKDSHLDIVHINIDDDDSLKEKWLDDIPVVFPDLNNYSVSEIKSDSVVKGLLEAADKNQSDLIAVATTHRSFWSGLFHKSTTKELLSRLVGHPLLTFHKGDE